jgi:hypothetical protein
MKKEKPNAVIKMGAKDVWQDISGPGKVWAKRIDSATDSNFWISFSASEVSADEICKFIREQISRAKKRIVYDHTAKRYQAAKVERGLQRLRIDAALGQIIAELEVLEGSGDSRGFSEWMARNSKGAGTLPVTPPLPPKPKLVPLSDTAEKRRSARIGASKKGKPHRRSSEFMPRDAWKFLRQEWKKLSAEAYNRTEKPPELQDRYGRQASLDSWPDYAASTLVRYAKCADYQAYLKLVKHQK